MKSVIILCCIAFAKGHFGYSFGARGFPFNVGPMGGDGDGVMEMNQAGTTVAPGPTAIGFGRGHSVSTRRGTVSTAVGKGIGIAPHNAGQRVKVGPITSVTGPVGTDNPTPGFDSGYGHGVDYNSAFGGYGPWGGKRIGANPGVVSAGTSAAISARETASSIADNSRNSGQQIRIKSSGTGRPMWTPHGRIGVADSVSSFVGTGLGHFPYSRMSTGLGEGSDFGGGIGSGGDDFLMGGSGGYPFIKKY